MSKENVRIEKLDYSKISDEVKKVVSEPLSDTIQKDVSISFDGKQFLCRFPKDVANAIGIKKGDKIRIRVELQHPDIKEKDKIKIDYIRSE